MKCVYCPEKDASLVPWDSLSHSDQTFLRDKYADAGQGAVCNLCVRSARPSAFFSRRSSSTSSSAPQSLDSGLHVPSAPRVVSGAATSLATEREEWGEEWGDEGERRCYLLGQEHDSWELREREAGEWPLWVEPEDEEEIPALTH